jgi:hypothetical protein
MASQGRAGVWQVPRCCLAAASLSGCAMWRDKQAMHRVMTHKTQHNKEPFDLGDTLTQSKHTAAAKTKERDMPLHILSATPTDKQTDRHTASSRGRDRVTVHHICSTHGAAQRYGDG